VARERLGLKTLIQQPELTLASNAALQISKFSTHGITSSLAPCIFTIFKGSSSMEGSSSMVGPACFRHSGDAMWVPAPCSHGG